MQHSGVYLCTPYLRDIYAALLYYISLETPSEIELILLIFINFIMINTIIIAMIIAIINVIELL